MASNDRVGFVPEGTAEPVPTTKRLAKGESVNRERHTGEHMDIDHVLNHAISYLPITQNGKDYRKKESPGRGMKRQPGKRLSKSFQDLIVTYNLLQEIANAPSGILIKQLWRGDATDAYEELQKLISGNVL